MYDIWLSCAHINTPPIFFAAARLVFQSDTPITSLRINLSECSGLILPGVRGEATKKLGIS
jgi:hypothetical protein